MPAWSRSSRSSRCWRRAAADAAAQTHPRLAKKGPRKIKIDSAPPGATVYIDKKELGPVGVTPRAGSTVLNGDYLIILELEGYQPAQRARSRARARCLCDLHPRIKKLDARRASTRAPTPTR
ncbi:MAG: PEGA domain-containing protein [Kofleriaceae bacterium]|nr:PEGA domain-containing protein [Kofleriaceae bacterium]